MIKRVGGGNTLFAYLAIVGDAAKRHWAWAIVMAIGLELAMLFTPYPVIFGIHTTAAFVLVTMAAHLVFGLSLGLLAFRLAVAPP